MADDCIKFWILHSGSVVGGRHSYDWNADDSKDLRICMDDAHWIFRNETGM